MKFKNFIQIIHNKIAHFKKLQRWKRAVKLVASNSAEVNKDFRKKFK